jgi:hypothetical protein
VEKHIYNIIMLPVVLYGRETWSLTLKEEHRLRAFEKRMLRRIFRAMRDGLMGDWEKCVMKSSVNCNLR